MVVEVLKNRPEGAQHGRVLFRQRGVDRETGSELEAGWNGYLRQDAQVPMQGRYPRCTFGAAVQRVLLFPSRGPPVADRSVSRDGSREQPRLRRFVRPASAPQWRNLPMETIELELGENGSPVTLEAAAWYVCFVPGLKKQWWHRFVNERQARRPGPLHRYRSYRRSCDLTAGSRSAMIRQ